MPLRRLQAKNLYNARDLGGFPTMDGRVTKFGVFVRSEAPCDLPPEDIQYLRDYGVTASLDFRGTGEIQARPSDLSEILPYYHRPLFNEAAMGHGPPHGGGHEKGPGGPPPGGGDFPDWGETYIEMVEEARDWAKDVLQIAADNVGAVLYHCTTGKDRTGIMTCYLLSIAGVEDRDIVADYCVSMVYLEPVFEQMRSGKMKMGPPPDGTEGDMPPMSGGFFRTPPEAMETVLGYLRETYGGVLPYLRKIGVPEETMEKIRQKFTEEIT